MFDAISSSQKNKFINVLIYRHRAKSDKKRVNKINFEPLDCNKSHSNLSNKMFNL